MNVFLSVAWLSVGSFFKVDAVTLSGEVSVSAWAQKRIHDDGQQHWLISLEQVERISASVSVAQDVILIFILFCPFLFNVYSTID